MNPSLSRDDDLLRLVSILHYICGYIGLLIGGVWLFFFVQSNLNRFSFASLLDPGFWTGLLLMFAVLGICSIPFWSGEFITRRVRRDFSIATSVILAIFFPIGSLIALVSLWVLTSQVTKTLYNETPIPTQSLPIVRIQTQRLSQRELILLAGIVILGIVTMGEGVIILLLLRPS